MVSSFDMTKLQSLLKDFYTITQIRITVFNDRFEELISYPEQVSNFCQIIRSDADGLAKCHLCDQNACAIAAKQKKGYTYQCHAGLTESIYPIILGELTIGYLFFGHVFSYPSHEKGWKLISEICKPYHIDMEELRTCCFDFPITSTEYIEAASHLLKAVASYLCMDRMIFLKKNDFPLQLDAYISEHLPEPMNAQSLCQHFGVGKTYLYEISNQNYGCGIAEHIRNLRIDKAKEMLLRDEALSINDIANQCGFDDYNYFITVFKKATGTTPKRFRQSERKNFYLKG